MSVQKDAEENLRIAGFFDKESDYDGMLGDAVMRLVKTHCDEGHSGFSSSYALMLFNKVINGQALTKEYWDKKKAELDKFAAENMGEPWKDNIIIDMIGERPK